MEESDSINKTWQERRNETNRMLIKYPERVCVKVERSSTETNLPDIKKQKYLVPHHINFAQLSYVIRKRIKLDANRAIFFFINKKIIPASGTLVKDLYYEHADSDGFLYVCYSSENTFG